MRWEEISEMAAPTDAMRGRVFYHGTSDTKSAKSILQGGLKGAETQGKGQLAPVAGKVYMTGNLSYAIMYALGGNFTHAMMERKDFSDPYGYLFVIKGSDLIDVQPDEDSVGEYLHQHAKVIGGSSRYAHDTNYDFDPSTGDQMDARIWHNLRHSVTDHQFKKIMRGEYAYYASGGKRALSKMPDWMKIELINRGAHIAHGGSIKPSECWKIKKTDVSKLKKDGSNFFEVAERIS